ncbi:MAG: FMN-binding protein [Clostridiales bacterium]|nr:FMN-binding protein [Eubacteriales bacterium]MDH7564866.1 FMN-binding protein [Clostridiales bacterium]
MKTKLISTLIFSILTISLCACTPTNTTQPGTTRNLTLPGTTIPGTIAPGTTAGTVSYKDGTYTGAADPWQYGSEDATVTILDGKIKSISLRRLDTSGKEVNYDEYAGQTKDGKTYPNLKKFRQDMADRMVAKQTYEVDTISGATTSTTNWKLAVKRALEKAKR